MDASQRTGQELSELYHRHVDTVWRVCYSFMKNRADTEDMVQEAFLRAYFQPFRSEEHEKAWLIVTASNLCKDALKRAWRRDEPLEDHLELAAPRRDPQALEAVLALPEHYKAAVYLYYYEGYDAKEVASILDCPQATVRTRLARARKQLKQMLGGEFE